MKQYTKLMNDRLNQTMDEYDFAWSTQIVSHLSHKSNQTKENDWFKVNLKLN